MVTLNSDIDGVRGKPAPRFSIQAGPVNLLQQAFDFSVGSRYPGRVQDQSLVNMPGGTAVSRIVFACSLVDLDPTHANACVGPALARLLIKQGFEVVLLVERATGPAPGDDPVAWLHSRGGALARPEGSRWEITLGGTTFLLPPARSAPTSSQATEPGSEFLRLFDEVFGQKRSDWLVVDGPDRWAATLLGRSRPRGVPAFALLHGGNHKDPDAFARADLGLTHSRLTVDYYHEVLGMPCVDLPFPIDIEAVRATKRASDCLLIVDPTAARGAYLLAPLIAALGRRRPDIPVLVVEGQGTAATLASSGLSAEDHERVQCLPTGTDPRSYWGRARLMIEPDLAWDAAPTTAIAALVNGVPILASDRGALPEILGESGVILPVPERVTPATQTPLIIAEVEPWVDAVARLWDDAPRRVELGRRALTEARRWEPGELGLRYANLFRERREDAGTPSLPPRRARAAVLVPHLAGVEWECEQGLRRIEQAGVRVVRRAGSSQVDVARNELLSDAVHDGFDAVLFIDADIGFDHRDALRLLARPEPVISGLYAKKQRRELASAFADGIAEVVLGTGAAGPYPLKYAATGFLRIRAEVLRRMIEALKLPLCNTKWGRGSWAFFQPVVVPDGADGHHYLGEDWAFSHRLSLIGVTPLADPTIRLWHHGRYGYGWEDAGSELTRYGTYKFRI